MKSYATPSDALIDVLQLAAAMTNKFAVPSLPYGGGKAVINIPLDFDPPQRPALLKRYGALIKRLGGAFLTGPDVGTNHEDMDAIAEAGKPYVFGSSRAGVDSGAITAAGVFAGIEVVCETIFGDRSPAGKTVLVQGAGNVGGSLIRRLCDVGAHVLVADVDSDAVKRITSTTPARAIPADALYATACDVFSPCALGGALNQQTIPLLRCAAVAGGANNQLAESQDATRLHQRGILYAPDYVVNVGGAMGLLMIETKGATMPQAEEEVTKRVREALRKVFSIAAATDRTAADAAKALARRNLEEAP